MEWTKHIIEKFGTLRSRNAQCSMFHVQCLAVALLLLSGCQSIEQLTIDYMEPAKVSFPDELKKVGIESAKSSVQVIYRYARRRIEWFVT